MSVDTVQAAARASADAYAEKLQGQLDKLEALATTISLVQIYPPALQPYDDFDKSPLVALEAAAQEIRDAKFDETTLKFKVYPDKIDPLDPNWKPIGKSPTYEPPDPLDPFEPKVEPGNAPDPINGGAPVLPVINAIVQTPLDFNIRIPLTPEQPVIEYPEISYITIPEFNVGEVPLEDLPNQSYLLDRSFSWTEEDYQSDLLDSLKTTLLTDMLYGGYGINPLDEVPLWERMREREMLAGNTLIEQATTGYAARGYALPPGALLGLIEKAQQGALEKISSAGRDIAMKRADLYVQNRQFTMTQSKEVEQMLITYWGYRQERMLKAAQIAVDVSVTIYNALATVYNTKVQAYKTSVDAYNARVQAALAPFERDKMALALTKTKADVYQSVVQGYQASVQAAMYKLDVNKSKIEQDKLRFEFEKAKLEQYVAAVQGFKGLVEAKASEYQGYTAQWTGYKAEVDAYVASVQSKNTEIDSRVKEFTAALEVFKLEYETRKFELTDHEARLKTYEAEVRATASENAGKLDVVKAQLATMGERLRGLSSAATGQSDYFKSVTGADIALLEAQGRFTLGTANYHIAKWDLQQKGYVASMNGYANAVQGFANAAAGVSAQIQNVT